MLFRSAALDCLSEILGQGKTSVMYQQLVKTQKVLRASANSRLNELAGEFTVQITPMPGQSLAQADSLYYAALKDFETRGVTDEDIEKYKGSIESQYMNRLQSVSGKVSTLAAFQTFTGNPNQMGNMMKAFMSVTKESVMRAYLQYVKGKIGRAHV